MNEVASAKRALLNGLRLLWTRGDITLNTVHAARSLLDKLDEPPASADYTVNVPPRHPASNIEITVKITNALVEYEFKRGTEAPFIYPASRHTYEEAVKAVNAFMVDLARAYDVPPISFGSFKEG